MKFGLALLTATWIIIAIGWFCPSIFKILGAALYALGEACEAMRSVFDESIRFHPRRVLHIKRTPAEICPLVEPLRSLTPVQTDVLTGLVNMGDTKLRAKTKLDRAIVAAGPNASFEDLWRKAVAA